MADENRTSAKESERRSRLYGRVITGEKGIGRFAVRFLGTKLDLRTVAYDPSRKIRTGAYHRDDFIGPALITQRILAKFAFRIPFVGLRHETASAHLFGSPTCALQRSARWIWMPSARRRLLL